MGRPKVSIELSVSVQRTALARIWRWVRPAGCGGHRRPRVEGDRAVDIRGQRALHLGIRPTNRVGEFDLQAG